jgi:hypothetical protein
MLALNDVEVISYSREVKYTNHNTVKNVFGSRYVPPTHTLDTGDRQTVSFDTFIQLKGAQIISADLDLVVFFRPSYFPFWQRHRVFHFISVIQTDGRLRLEQQPSTHY